MVNQFLRPELTPDVTFDAFIFMTELILIQWKHCTPESKVLLLNKYLDYYEQGFIPAEFDLETEVEKKEFQLIKKVISSFKNYSRTKLNHYCKYIIDNQTFYSELRAKLTDFRVRLAELKAKSEEFSPQAYVEVLLELDDINDKLKQKENQRKAQRKQLVDKTTAELKRQVYYKNDSTTLQLENYLDFWSDKKLIPKFEPNGNIGRFLGIILRGFEYNELYETANQIRNHDRLISVLNLVRNSYRELYDLIELYRDALDPKIQIDQSKAYNVFKPFCRDFGERLFYASFFQDIENTFHIKKDIVAAVIKAIEEGYGYPDSSRIGLRIRECYSSKKPSDKLESLSRNAKIHLLKDLDFDGYGRVLQSLLIDNVTKNEISTELKNHFSSIQIDQILLQFSAIEGDVKAQLQILENRQWIDHNKLIREMSKAKYQEVVKSFYLKNKDNLQIREKYVECSLQSASWPDKLSVEDLLASSQNSRLKLLALAIREKIVDKISLLEINLKKDIKDLADSPEVERALRHSASKEFVLEFLERNPTSNVELLFFAAKNHNSQRNLFLNKLEEIYSQDPTPDTAEKILSVTGDYSSRGDDFLHDACSASSSKISQMASIEIAFRNFVKGDLQTARKYVERYANWNLDSAHLMYQIEPENIDWLKAMDLNFNVIDMTRIKNQFSLAGLAPATQLDDPRYHIGLIEKGDQLRRVVKRQSKYQVPEDWICRKNVFAKLHGEESNCTFHPIVPYQLTSTDFKLEDEAKINFARFNLIQSQQFLLGSALEISKQPYEWQLAALNSWAEHGRHGVVEAVTGSGKSQVGTLAIAEALNDSYAVLVIVPTRALGDQWMTQSLGNFRKRRILNRLGNSTSRDPLAPYSQGARPGYVTVAVMSAELESDIDAWISNGMTDTRLMLVADEVHHLGGGSYQKLLNPSFERRMGLTATLSRDEYDNSRLKNYFSGDPVYKYDFTRAISEKVIVPFTLIALGVRNPEHYNQPYRIIEAKLRKSRENLQNKLGSNLRFKLPVSELYENARRILDDKNSLPDYINVAKDYISIQDEFDTFLEKSGLMNADGAILVAAPLIAKFGKTAIFADFRDTSKNVIATLSTKKIDCEFIQGDTVYSERTNILERLSKGEIHAVVSPRVLDEGIDIQNLTIGLFAGRIRSRRVLTQRLGRILRKHPEKSVAVAILMYVVGSLDDPTRKGNERLEESEFDFVGRNALGEIKNFVIGEDNDAFSKFVETLDTRPVDPEIKSRVESLS